MSRMRVGLIGCGNIADAYLAGAARSLFVEAWAVADLRPEAAASKAAAHGLRALPVEALLEDPSIAIVVNLTVPEAHAEVSHRIIAAGKHVYSEKPLGVTFAEGQALVQAAAARGVRLGSAPDTFLGAGHQAVRALIDAGRIGHVTGAAATFANGGMEMWHPNPFFFFRRGGGPVLDIGCYPIAQLVNCLGPVEGVVAHASRGRARRVVTSAPHAGAEIAVEVPTTVNGILAFASGANVTLTASWDIWKHGHGPLEFYGTEGTILNPDPNLFGGKVLVSEKWGEWQPVDTSARPFGKPTRFAPDGQGIADYRMLGVADMAAAIAAGRPHRAGPDFALHVLEVMEALHVAAETGRRVALSTRCARPEPVPEGAGEEVLAR